MAILEKVPIPAKLFGWNRNYEPFWLFEKLQK